MAETENAQLAFAKCWVFDGERNVLPEDVLALVFEFLVDDQSICRIQLVCRASRHWKRRAIHRRKLDWVYRNVKIVLGSRKMYQLRNRSLTTMSFHVDYICDTGARVIGEVLKVNTSLTELVLSRNNIGDKGGKAIGEALKVNASLTRIDLSHNEIGDEGAKAIGEALKVNTSLTKIYLDSNNIGDEGGKAIGEGLKVNTSLTSIDIYGNNIGAEGREALREAKEVNAGCNIAY